MFCIKCGKKFEKPGICRFCGEDNTVVSENTYSGSAEIYILLRDEAEVLSEILNADNNKNDIKIDAVQAAEPEISSVIADVIATVDEKAAIQAEIPVGIPADTPAEEMDIPADGEIISAEEEIAVPDFILPKEDEIPYKRESRYKDDSPYESIKDDAAYDPYEDDIPAYGRKKAYETEITPYDKFMKYKRWTIIVLVGILAVILLILLISSCGSDKKDKKSSSVDSGNSYGDVNENQTTTAATTLSAETTTTVATTEPVPEDDGSVKAAVVNTNPANADIASGIISLLGSNGYTCREVNLTADDISAYDMVILPMPVDDLNDAQIGKLNKFLKMENKNLLYLPSMAGAETANINKFLAEWDIGADNEGNVFFNSTPGYYMNEGLSGDGYRLMVSVADSEAVGGGDYSAADICAPDTKEIYDLGQKENINVTKVLTVPENSMLIIKALTAPATENSNSGNRASVLIAEDVSNTSSHVIVFGSSTMFSNAYTGSSDFANKAVILGILNNAVGKTSDTSSAEN